jgi:hypothetical protein
MAKYVEKKIEIDADQFDASQNPGQWPAGVRVNAGSPTGYSYGTLAEIQAPMGPGYVRVDGFPVRNLDFIITDRDGIKYSLAPDEFNARYSDAEFKRIFVNGGSSALQNETLAPVKRKKRGENG